MFLISRSREDAKGQMRRRKINFVLARFLAATVFLGLIAGGGYADSQDVRDQSIAATAQPVKSSRTNVEGRSIIARGETDAKAETKAKVHLSRAVREEHGRDDPARKVKPGSGKTFRDCADCPEMVVVPAGRFAMGSPVNEVDRADDEGPQHEVIFAKPFAVGKFEVTWGEWDACVRDGRCNNGPVEEAGGDNGWGKGRRPVFEINLQDAKTYAAWLSKKTGKTYRVLSEAEWEYAARAGTTTAYFWGDTFDSTRANNGSKTVEVGQYRANPWGLHDMHGNVWEWTNDCWNKNYDGAPTDGSAWMTGVCGHRMVRGGSWYYGSKGLRSATRLNVSTGTRSSYLGFRLARTLTP